MIYPGDVHHGYHYPVTCHLLLINTVCQYTPITHISMTLSSLNTTPLLMYQIPVTYQHTIQLLFTSSSHLQNSQISSQIFSFTNVIMDRHNRFNSNKRTKLKRLFLSPSPNIPPTQILSRHQQRTKPCPSTDPLIVEYPSLIYFPRQHTKPYTTVAHKHLDQHQTKI